MPTDRLSDLTDRLTRYGYARNRTADHEPREITITDNDAVLIIEALKPPADDDLAPLTEHEAAQADKLSRAVHRYARDKTESRLDRAVEAGVINADQAATLMQMWDEDSPYEPITNPPDQGTQT